MTTPAHQRARALYVELYARTHHGFKLTEFDRYDELNIDLIAAALVESEHALAAKDIQLEQAGAIIVARDTERVQLQQQLAAKEAQLQQAIAMLPTPLQGPFREAQVILQNNEVETELVWIESCLQNKKPARPPQSDLEKLLFNTLRQLISAWGNANGAAGVFMKERDTLNAELLAERGIKEAEKKILLAEVEKNTALHAELARCREAVEKLECPACRNIGWYEVPNRNTGEPEQEQCRFCVERQAALGAGEQG